MLINTTPITIKNSAIELVLKAAKALTGISANPSIILNIITEKL
jgi:hypothetical protein